MARRDFRQLGLADSIVRRRSRKSEWLDRLDAALDWPALERVVGGVYASREGGLAYPLLTYVKLLLLQQWYGLSDEGLEAAVDDRLSFRRFAGIPLAESVPDHSSVWRFREQLAKRGVAEELHAGGNRQLDAKGMILRRGTLIDATILEAAVRPPAGDAGEVSPRDPQAGGTKKNGRERVGLKAAAAGGVDQEERQEPVRLQGARRGRRGQRPGPRGGDDARGRPRQRPGRRPRPGRRGSGLRRQGLRQRGAAGRAPGARYRAADHAQGAARPAAQAVADGVQQGGGADPGRRRAAVRDHEAGLRLPAGTLPRAGAQRRPAAGPVRRHQPAAGARPRAGLRGGVCPVRPRKGEGEVRMRR